MGADPNLEVLFDADAIAQAVSRLAREIRRDLAGARVFAVPVMNASLLFAADLLRALADGLAIEGFAAASVASYGAGGDPAGPPRVLAFPPAEHLAGRTVLVLDTILDTGATADAVVRECRARGAAEVRLACLLDKACRRRVPVRADWVGFEAPDRFLVGYGLDAAGRHRLLPYVAAPR